MRLVGLLLSVALVVGGIPVSAFAESATNQTIDVAGGESAETEVDGAQNSTDPDDAVIEDLTPSLTDEEQASASELVVEDDAPADGDEAHSADLEPVEEEPAVLVAQEDGSLEEAVESETKDISHASVVVADQTYTGKALKPQVRVSLGQKALVQGTDYSVSYSANQNVGTAIVVVKGKDAYVGSVTATFRIMAASIAKATISKIENQAYTGKSVQPKPTIRLGGRTLKADTDYSLAYENNVGPGTARITVKGKGNYKGNRSVAFKVVTPVVSYKVHRQTYGWETSWHKNGQVSGTTGESRRLEGIYLKLGSSFPVSGGITYRTHVQTYGWESTWAKDGGLSGTTGESRRLEAIQIKLTGTMEKKYDIYYRVHAQRIGWMAWAKNGAVAGTSGMSWRLEAIQVVLVPKGMAAPKNEGGVESITSFAKLSNPGITYRSYVRGTGWLGWARDGEASGNVGESPRLGAIGLKLAGDGLRGSVKYRTRMEGARWSDWKSNGGSSGSTGNSKSLEAMQIKLTGQVAEYLDVWYRVHAQSRGWLGWAKNGTQVGAVGSRHIDAYQVRLVPKDGAAPGSTNQPYWVETVREGLESALASRSVMPFGGFEPSAQAIDRLNMAVVSLLGRGYDVGFIMMDLATHKGVAYNCDGVFYGASSIKAPYIASVVSRYPEAIVSHKFYMQETLFYSWDYAYKEVYYSYGRDPMRVWCQNSGARGSIAESLPWANYSARDLALMWAHTYVWYPKSDAMETLGTWCERPNISTIHDTLGNRYRTRSKGGWIADGGAIYEGVNGGGPLWDVTDDGGIVYAGNGDYVMAIMSSVPASHPTLGPLTSAIGAAHDEI